MTEITKIEQPPIWSFFCEHLGEGQMNETESKKEAIHNILDIDNSQLLIFHTEEFVKNRLANGITSSQLRKLFEIVKDKKLSEKLNEVRIQLIYIAARQNNPSAHEFAHFIKELITHIGEDENKLKRFRLFMESIVSYHKYHSKR